MKTPRSLTFGKKIDGYIATEEDWNRWREEFWEKEAKIIYITDLTKKRVSTKLKEQGQETCQARPINPWEEIA